MQTTCAVMVQLIVGRSVLKLSLQNATLTDMMSVKIVSKLAVQLLKNLIVEVEFSVFKI